MVKCKICKRKLSNTLSLKRSIGRVCYRKWKAGYRGIQIEPFEDVNKISEILVRK